MTLSPTSSRTASSGSAGSQTLLSTTTLGADGTFDVTGISQAYNDLLLVIVARGTRPASNNDSLMLQLNGDTGANYHRWNVNGNGTAAGSSQATGQTSGFIGDVPAASATAAKFATLTATIYGYTSGVWHKNVVAQCGQLALVAGPVLSDGLYSSQWASLSAVNRVTLFGNSTANLLAGSVLRIYGVL